LPRLDVPEIAFVGRSSAGNHLHHLTQQHRLASNAGPQNINLFTLGKRALCPVRGPRPPALATGDG
jgi:GTP-binding protein